MHKWGLKVDISGILDQPHAQSTQPPSSSVQTDPLCTAPDTR